MSQHGRFEHELWKGGLGQAFRDQWRRLFCGIEHDGRKWEAWSNSELTLNDIHDLLWDRRGRALTPRRHGKRQIDFLGTGEPARYEYRHFGCPQTGAEVLLFCKAAKRS